MKGSGFILVDVDGTVACGRSAPKCRPRPGMSETLQLLTMLGFTIAFWSAGGADHARAVAEHCGYLFEVGLFFNKPDHPMTAEQVVALLGEEPVLQIDDEPTEKVGDWPFFQIEGWYGDVEARASGLLVPLPDEAIEAMGWDL